MQHPVLARRSLAALALGLALPGARRAWAAAADARTAIAAIEGASGGRLGVAALDTGTGRRVDHRADERFPLCSTHKLLTAAAILARVDRGGLDLARRVPFGPADLLGYAPVTRAAVGEGALTVEALCVAAVRWSDNTADTLLLRLLGGPAGWTAWVRSTGDAVSRLDRTEPALNEAAPGDPRDTTTPSAMLHDLDAVLLGDALSAGSRARLEGWMTGSGLTDDLLRAGLPPGWRVADKSGAGDNGTRADVGILRRPGGAPVLLGVFLTGSPQPMAARDRVIADVGRAVAASLS